MKDEKWQSVTGEDILKVNKSEAQTWFSLRQLLINKNAMENYAITEFRQREIAKCTGLLNDILLDQLPVLVELKQYLCQLQIGGSSSGKSQCNFLLEELPEVDLTLYL
jgi:zinc finger MYND domain-containing protein 10